MDDDKIIVLEKLRTFFNLFLSLIEGYVQDVKDYVDSKVGEGVDLSNYATKDYVGNARLVLHDQFGNTISDDFTANKSGNDVTIKIDKPIVIIRQHQEEKDVDESEAEKVTPTIRPDGSIELKFWATGIEQTFNVIILSIGEPKYAYSSFGVTSRMLPISFFIQCSNVNWYTLTGAHPTNEWSFRYRVRGTNVRNKILAQDVKMDGNYNWVDIYLSSASISNDIVNGMVQCDACLMFNDEDITKITANAFTNFRGHLTLRNNP